MTIFIIITVIIFLLIGVFGYIVFKSIYDEYKKDNFTKTQEKIIEELKEEPVEETKQPKKAKKKNKKEVDEEVVEDDRTYEEILTEIKETEKESEETESVSEEEKEPDTKEETETIEEPAEEQSYEEILTEIKVTEEIKKEQEELEKAQQELEDEEEDEEEEEIEESEEPQEEQPAEEEIETKEEPKVVIKDIVKKNHQTSTVLFFNDFVENKIFLLNYVDGILEESKEVDLSGINFINGVADNIVLLSEKIKENIKDTKKIDVVLNVKEGFSTIVSLPKMSAFTIKKYYDKEIKNDFPNYNEKYNTYVHSYTHKLGTIFSTYFMPIEIINVFKKVSQILSIKLNTIDLWENHLYNNISLKCKGDYAVIYIYDKVCTMLNSLNSKLVTYNTFAYENEYEIISNFYSTILKHEFELEKQGVKNYILISNKEEIDLSEITDKLQKIDCDVDFKQYHINGK